MPLKCPAHRIHPNPNQQHPRRTARVCVKMSFFFPACLRFPYWRPLSAPYRKGKSSTTIGVGWERDAVNWLAVPCVVLPSLTRTTVDLRGKWCPLACCKSFDHVSSVLISVCFFFLISYDLSHAPHNGLPGDGGIRFRFGGKTFPPHEHTARTTERTKQDRSTQTPFTIQALGYVALFESRSRVRFNCRAENLSIGLLCYSLFALPTSTRAGVACVCVRVYVLVVFFFFSACLFSFFSGCVLLPFILVTINANHLFHTCLMR